MRARGITRLLEMTRLEVKVKAVVIEWFMVMGKRFSRFAPLSGASVQRIGQKRRGTRAYADR
jgi:hypothetical protein